jgi:hypothetical protein
VVHLEQDLQPVVTRAALEESCDLRAWPRGQQNDFESILDLTLNCLHCELPTQIGRMAGLLSLRVTFYTPCYTALTYPPLSGLQSLQDLSIHCYSDDVCECAGSLPTDLEDLSALVAFEASIFQDDPICQLRFGTQLTELHLDYQWGQGGSEVSLSAEAAFTRSINLLRQDCVILFWRDMQHLTFEHLILSKGRYKSDPSAA